MFENQKPHTDKKKRMVRILTTDKRMVEGEIFVAQGERLIDVLNDSRMFIPVELVTGEVYSLAKSGIIDAVEVACEPQTRRSPFAVLGIQKTASPQEVRGAWMKQVKANHPDRISALGVDEEVAYAARRATQRLNIAYDEIITTMKSKRTAEKTKATA